MRSLLSLFLEVLAIWLLFPFFKWIGSFTHLGIASFFSYFLAISHIQIIDDYFQGLSMGKIAKKLNRSAATVHAQIHSHDQVIGKFGYCVKCRRLKGTHETEKTIAKA